MSDCKSCHHKNEFNSKLCEICEKSMTIKSGNQKNIHNQNSQPSAVNFNDPMVDAKIDKYKKILFGTITSSPEKTDAILSLCDLKRKGSLKAEIILEKFSKSPIENNELQKLALNSQ